MADNSAKILFKRTLIIPTVRENSFEVLLQ